jgi:hypothetical protein
LKARIVRQTEVMNQAYIALKAARKTVKTAEEHRGKVDGRAAAELFRDAPDPNVVCARVEAIIVERDNLPEAKAAARAAAEAHQEAAERLADLQAELPKLDEKEAFLTSRKEIFAADTELDRIVSYFKLGFVLLAEHVMREYFPGLNVSLETFVRQILMLPAKRVVDGYQEFIHLATPPNKAILAALEQACERVNVLQVRRNGLVLRLSVGPPGRGQHQRSRAAS